MQTREQLEVNLALVLQYMKASEQLLVEATMLADGELAEYFAKHLVEETDHAKWLAEDLGGFELPLNAICVAMAGTAYYLVKHVHPACLLGYMAALEKPFPMDKLEELEQAYGKLMLRTLRIHAEEDRGHEKALWALIEKQPEDVRKHIAVAYTWTQSYLNQLSANLSGAH